MGVTYKSIDGFLLTGEAEESDKIVIERFHKKSGHKRRPAPVYGMDISTS
jgi:NAD+ synthase